MRIPSAIVAGLLVAAACAPADDGGPLGDGELDDSNRSRYSVEIGGDRSIYGEITPASIEIQELGDDFVMHTGRLVFVGASVADSRLRVFQPAGGPEQNDLGTPFPFWLFQRREDNWERIEMDVAVGIGSVESVHIDTFESPTLSPSAGLLADSSALISALLPYKEDLLAEDIGYVELAHTLASQPIDFAGAELGIVPIARPNFLDTLGGNYYELLVEVDIHRDGCFWADGAYKCL